MNVGYFDYEGQYLSLNNAYLKTVLQEADYQDLNGENADCNMSGEYITDTFNDKEVKIYTFDNLDSMRIFYMEGENFYSLYDLGGFYYICTKEYAIVNLEGSVLKTKNICRIAEKDGKYNMIINPSSPSYTGTINTHDEWLSIKEVTGFTFLEGKTYKIQIQNSACLKIGKAVFNYNNEKFDYKAIGNNLFIKTGYLPCILTILEDGVIEQDDVQPISEKGSFDKATQTLTLNNAYIVDLINQVTDETKRTEALQIIGDKDAIFDFADVQLMPETTDKYYCPVKNIIFEDVGPAYMIAFMSGGDYSIVVYQVLGCMNDEGLSTMGATLEQLKQMGYGVDENVFTITGTQGNYDVTFN